MNKKTIIKLVTIIGGIIIFLVLSIYILGNLFWYSSFECKNTHEEYIKLIAKNNNCLTNQDCTVLDDPYCGHSVNKNGDNRLFELNAEIKEKNCGIPISCVHVTNPNQSLCNQSKCIISKG